MDVAVDAACSDNHAFCGNDLRSCTDRNAHPGLDVRVSCLADLPDAAVLEADVGLDDAPVVDDQRVGDDRVGDLRGHALALPHAVTDDFAAAEFHLLAVDGEILLDLDPELGVREPHPVAGRRSEHFCISLARDFHFLSFPMTLPAKPYIFRSPATSTSSTVLV